MKTVKVKLFGTHMDSGLMYRVYKNQGQGPITLKSYNFVKFMSIFFVSLTMFYQYAVLNVT